MAEPVILSVDALGGDDAPQIVLDGVEQAIEVDSDLNVILCGPADVVDPFASSHARCEAHPTTEVIEMGEHPAHAVRSKKDSSLVVSCRLVKQQVTQGFFSAGSTGACLAAATLIMGRIRGVKRPALGQVLPSYASPTLLIDVGANADCHPEYLVQFAKMGIVYARSIMGVENPKVGLLNIGEEESKGSSFAQEAYVVLSRSIAGFAGNCEGGELFEGAFDVVVCDGFSGNVCLKSAEGATNMMFKYLEDAFSASMSAKVGASLAHGQLSRLKGDLSPDAFGGAPLLGVEGACVVGHGSSSDLAVRNGILVCATTVRSHVSEVIAESVTNGGTR